LNKSVFTGHVSWSLTLAKAKTEGQKI